MHACVCTHACVLAWWCAYTCKCVCVFVCVCVRAYIYTLSIRVALGYRTQMVGGNRSVLSTLRPWDPLLSGRSSHADDAEDPVTIALRKEGIMPLPASARGDCMWLY